jgi:hypothetical protein
VSLAREIRNIVEAIDRAKGGQLGPATSDNQIRVLSFATISSYTTVDRRSYEQKVSRIVHGCCDDGGGIVFAADVNIGTWKLNLAKSKFNPGPAPKSQTLTIEAWGDDGVSYTADGIGLDGKPMRWEFQAKYDGKDYVFKGNPDADMIAYKRIDAYTVEATTKLKGKVAGSTRVVVSRDGKTRTLTQTGKNAAGQNVNNLLVYEKQ